MNWRTLRCGADLNAALASAGGASITCLRSHIRRPGGS
jgi:hypothetical protein